MLELYNYVVIIAYGLTEQQSGQCSIRCSVDLYQNNQSTFKLYNESVRLRPY